MGTGGLLASEGRMLGSNLRRILYPGGLGGGGEGGSNSTPDQFMLWKLELVSAESYELAGFKRLFQHKRIVTPHQLLMRGQSQSRIRASFSGRYLRVNI